MFAGTGACGYTLKSPHYKGLHSFTCNYLARHSKESFICGASARKAVLDFNSELWRTREVIGINLNPDRLLPVFYLYTRPSYFIVRVLSLQWQGRFMDSDHYAGRALD